MVQYREAEGHRQGVVVSSGSRPQQLGNCTVRQANQNVVGVRQEERGCTRGAWTKSPRGAVCRVFAAVTRPCTGKKLGTTLDSGQRCQNLRRAKWQARAALGGSNGSHIYHYTNQCALYICHTMALAKCSLARVSDSVREIH